jgi:hypothetical protein
MAAPIRPDNAMRQSQRADLLPPGLAPGEVRARVYEGSAPIRRRSVRWCSVRLHPAESGASVGGTAQARAVPGEGEHGAMGGVPFRTPC